MVGFGYQAEELCLLEVAWPLESGNPGGKVGEPSFTLAQHNTGCKGESGGAVGGTSSQIGPAQHRLWGQQVHGGEGV